MMKVSQQTKIQTKFGSLSHCCFVIRTLFLSLHSQGIC